jgi:hypothetical protein
MADSKTCQFCGGVIRFRMIQGICVPLHDGSIACTTHGSSAQPNSCCQTTCPHCGGKVYFVRHNNGAVWFQELGKPWEKHPCFDHHRHPVEPIVNSSFSIVRIRDVLKYFKHYGRENEGNNYCFQILIGIARCRPIVWYILPESGPELLPEKILKWKGRYCYYSKEAGELVLFNGTRIVLFTRDEV